LATVSKQVTFYDTVVITDKNDGKGPKTKTVGADFWNKLLDKIEALSDHNDRIHKIRQRQFYGIVSRPKSPAINHLQVGRLRDLSEHLEQTNLKSGQVGPLILPDPNLRVSEPTFVVPFGTKGRVAIMSPGQSTRPETIANWLTGVLALVPKGKSIEFRPVVDVDTLTKILSSKGAVGVDFHLDTDRQLPKGNSLLDAVESVRAEGPSNGTLYVGWSLGREGGTMKDKSIIKKLATEIAVNKLARRASVNLVVEDEQGNLHREQHDLFEDHIVSKVSYRVASDVRVDTSTILTAISKSIQDFNKLPGV